MKREVDPEKFDEEYFDRFYERPETRASSPEEFASLTRFVLAYLKYLEIPVREVLDLGCGLDAGRTRWKDTIRRFDTSASMSHLTCAENTDGNKHR